MASNSIKVVCRFRPQNRLEIENGAQPIVTFETEDTCNLDSKEAAGSFTFDRVFAMDSKQSDIFDFSIRPTVDDILNGYNGTVFAYGQTGAGKSYTMMGTDIDNDEGRGIIPRIVEQIFASILSSPSTIEYTVRVSYMEIYMERIRDLLAPQNDNLPVHEEKNRGVYVKGLLEVYVSSVQEVYEVLRRGGSSRAVAATNMNAESSRSHSIFVITVTQKNVETGSAKSGQLFLVDLAGSEKVGKTGASGQTLEEAKKINKSLSALGMVINSLTDGKSSHVPYRDSKLTRILQESLGGNSRTTLVINCSPSSYNDAETLSTLRFGMRAKTIKNKAKINAELSPAELKIMLKKSQTHIATFQTFYEQLDAEVQQWRSGAAVPKEKWAPAFSATADGARPSSLYAPRPSTPSKLMPDSARSETPTILERSGTPSLPLDKDERDEFLRRENELQDQISERESQIALVEKSLKEVKEELSFLKEHDTKASKDNERLMSEINDYNMQLERLSFEAKEDKITLDSFKEANHELTAELDGMKQELLDAKMAARESSVVADEKDKKKAEKMAKMMASFDTGSESFSENESQVVRVIEHINQLQRRNQNGEAISSTEFEDLRSKVEATQALVRQAELSLYGSADSDAISRRNAELQTALDTLESKYEALLEQNLSPADIEECKSRLEHAYGSKADLQRDLVDGLKMDIAQKSAENSRLRAQAEELSGRLATGGTSSNGVSVTGSKSVAQQIADFDTMKKSLMRDLQARCERVVELEIALDETREQYNHLFRTTNNRQQQKKMAFLERNLEQLTHVQRSLVEQNSSLKKEVAIAERKLIARNERIQSLEQLLQDSQEKLTAANHRFEAQLTAVKERLEAAKLGSTRGLNASAGGLGGFSFASAGSRIAKPLRGGGGDAVTGGPPSAGVSALQSDGAKRSSGFFSWNK